MNKLKPLDIQSFTLYSYMPCNFTIIYLKESLPIVIIRALIKKYYIYLHFIHLIKR